jgi:hypothetical protein
VSFDQQAQLEALKSVKQVTEDTGRRFRAALTAWMAALRERLTTAGGLFFVLGAGAGLAGLIAAVVWLRRRAGETWRGFRMRWRGGEALVRRDAGRLLARFAGLPVPASDRAVVEALQRLRYGARPTWGDPAPVLRLAKAVLARGPR